MKECGKLAFFFSLGTFLSRISGMAREVAMAFVLGTTPAAAAFLIAFRFAYLLRRLFGESALVSSFIPHYQTIRTKDEAKAANFFGDLFATMGVLLLGLIGLLELILFLFLQWFHVQESNAEILRLIMLSLPGLLFICLFALHCGFLQCHGKFFLTGVAPIAFNVAWIGTLVFFRHLPARSVTSYLAIALDIAFLSQWAILLPVTWRKLQHSLSCWRVHLFSKEIRNMLSSMALTIIGVGAAQVNGFIDTLFARYADLSGPAYLAYAMRIEQFPLALFGIAISSALFPSLARAISNGQEKESQELLQFGISRTTLLIIPCTIGLFFLGAQSIHLLFRHGQFDDLSTVKTTVCLWAYGLGLLPTALTLLFSQAFFARQDFKTPMMLSCLSIFINMVCNGFMIFCFHLGAVSVAFSTSFAAFVHILVLYLIYRKRYGVTHMRWSAFSRIFVSISAAAMACFASSLWIGDHSFLTILQGMTPQFEQGLLRQIVYLCVPSLAFFCVFAILNRSVFVKARQLN